MTENNPGLLEGRIYTIHSLGKTEIDTRVRGIAALDEVQARDLTDQIRQTSVRLWLLVTEAHDRKAHLALGYETWADYVKAELNMSESRSYQYLDTGHVMKALASAGIDLDEFPVLPVRVVARVKDRLTDVRKAATQAVAKGEDVDKAIRALAREPRKGTQGAGAAAAGGTPEPPEPQPPPEPPDLPRPGRGQGVPCPACAGTGKVTQEVSDRLLVLFQRHLNP